MLLHRLQLSCSLAKQAGTFSGHCQGQRVHAYLHLTRCVRCASLFCRCCFPYILELLNCGLNITLFIACHLFVCITFTACQAPIQGARTISNTYIVQFYPNTTFPFDASSMSESLGYPKYLEFSSLSFRLIFP